MKRIVRRIARAIALALLVRVALLPILGVHDLSNELGSLFGMSLLTDAMRRKA